MIREPLIRTGGAASIESDAPPGVLLNATKRTNLDIIKTYFKFACVYCGQHIECETTLSGRQIKCPACGNRIVIPAQEKRATGPEATADEIHLGHRGRNSKS